MLEDADANTNVAPNGCFASPPALNTRGETAQLRSVLSVSTGLRFYADIQAYIRSNSGHDYIADFFLMTDTAHYTAPYSVTSLLNWRFKAGHIADFLMEGHNIISLDLMSNGIGT